MFQRIESQNISVVLFRKYLKRPTIHPNDNYNDCLKFLTTRAHEMDMKMSTVYIKPNTPVFIGTCIGTNPQLSSVLLLSHMDVAPVNAEEWSVDPFRGKMKNGIIYGRGAQDMKCIGIQYLEAIRKLKADSKTCSRNIHVCFLPEGGVGCQSMALFVNTDEFQNMNVGVCLDAGRASVIDEFLLFTSDKISWQFTFRCRGSAGHNTLLIDNTPGEQLTYIMRKSCEFRTQQINMFESQIDLEDLVVINCTQVGGGDQQILIPRELTVTFDCLIPCSYDLNTFEEMLNGWCQGAGLNCTLEFHVKQQPTPETKLESDNFFWIAFRDVVEEMGLKLEIHKGWNNSDSRYLRIRGIPCFNFSPINNTGFLSQGFDEFLRIHTYLEGISIYYNIIHKLANAL